MKKELGMTFAKTDCLSFLGGVPDSSIRLIIADPPYNIGFTGSTSNTRWDQRSEAEFSRFTVDWLSEAKRVLTDDGSIWMFCDRTKIPALFKDIETVGLVNDLENWAIWCRAKGRASTKRLKSVREDILHLTKTNKHVWNAAEYLKKVVCPYRDETGAPRGWATDIDTGDRVRYSGIGNVLYYSSPSWSSKVDRQIHSTQKPVGLLLTLMVVGSNPGDLVLDPFMGSGSTALAALACGREFSGCDIDGEMVEKAQARVKNCDLNNLKLYYSKHIR